MASTIQRRARRQGAGFARRPTFLLLALFLICLATAFSRRRSPPASAKTWDDGVLRSADLSLAEASEMDRAAAAAAARAATAAEAASRAAAEEKAATAAGTTAVAALMTQMKGGTEDGAAAAAAAAGDGSALGERSQCHMEAGSEYDGEKVVVPGSALPTTDAAECCARCTEKPECNVWVWCGKPECSGNRAFGECWLKQKQNLDPIKPQGRRDPTSGWTSGALFTVADVAAAERSAAEAEARAAGDLGALRANASLPLVFFDVAIKGEAVGRIEMALFPDVAPRAAENFRQLCTGEAGVVPEGREGAGKAYHFKGAPFYRIIDQFIDQAGVNVESVFGGQFKDDPGGLKLRHTRKGLLSMANMGPNTNTAHFSIMVNLAPHLDGSYTIFGQVVAGLDVVDRINALSKGQPDNTATAAAGARIENCGQLRKGILVPDLTLGMRR